MYTYIFLLYLVIMLMQWHEKSSPVRYLQAMAHDLYKSMKWM